MMRYHVNTDGEKILGFFDRLCDAIFPDFHYDVWGYWNSKFKSLTT